MLEGLADCGVNAVRVGQPVKVREALRSATVDARIAEHPLSPAIEEEVARYQVGIRAGPASQLLADRGRGRGRGGVELGGAPAARALRRW
jgi:uncharacterized phage protein gp47/JayE